MVELTRDFQEILEKFGPPKPAVMPNADQIAAYRGKLPQPLLDFWTLHGWGIWKKGYFQLCNPADFKGVLDIYLANDPDFPSRNCHVIGYAGFGRLAVWHEKLFECEINAPRSILTSIYWGRFDPPTADWIIGSTLYGADDQIHDMRDENGVFMFSRALKKLGPLAPGEVYGFKLAPQLGGKFTLDNLAKKKAVEYFGMLAQMEPLRFMDYSTPQPKFIRLIGTR
ncbi:MAG: GAD-like domain-containing protein [Beijerinckiaceae bacterium]